MLDEKNKYYFQIMTDKKIILIASGLAVVFLMTYVICFWGTGLSGNTTDWGAFGSYAAICVGLLSIALIYVTYREQRRTNEITRVEQHIETMTNTLCVLSEKYHMQFEVSYCKFSEHLKLPFYDMSDWEYNNTIEVCKIYYSMAVDDEYIGNFNYVFRYMQLCVDYILNEDSFSSENKTLRITEFSCTLPESLRILLFCWLLINDQTKLEVYYKSGIFMLEETASPLLDDIVTYICTGKQPLRKISSEVNPDDIILEDFPNEQFNDTYNRLFKNSKTGAKCEKEGEKKSLI